MVPEELDEREEAALRRIAANLRHWRRLRGMTQRTLALELEMNTATVRGLEAARATPSVRTLAHLALIFEVDLTELVAAREPAQRPTGRPARSR